jgi:hypothetical protein
MKKRLTDELPGPRNPLLDDEGFAPETFETLNAFGATHRNTSRRRVRSTDDDREDHDPDTLPDEEPPGWAEVER